MNVNAFESILARPAAETCGDHGPVLQTTACPECGDDSIELRVPLGNDAQACLRCVHELKARPRPVRLTAEEILEAENAVRDKMTRRGGPDRHMVRSGRT